MLGWIITFLVIALIAGALGLVVLQAPPPASHRFSHVFLVILLISIVLHFTRGRAP